MECATTLDASERRAAKTDTRGIPTLIVAANVESDEPAARRDTGDMAHRATIGRALVPAEIELFGDSFEHLTHVLLTGLIDRQVTRAKN